MSRTVAAVGALILVALGVVIWWQTRPRPSDEAQIVNVILEVKRAVEDKRAGKVLEHISDDYDDGTYSKREITRLALQGFRETEPFHVHVQNPDIQVSGEKAQVGLRAEFWMGQPGTESDHIPLDLVLDLVKTSRGWQVIRVKNWDAVIGVGS